MGSTTFSGPVRAGTVRDNAANNVGNVVLSQTDTFTFADTSTFATNIILPASSQIVQMFVDVDTVWNSVTSDALEIGDGTDADAYGDVADLQVAGRTIASVDGTQAAAIDDIGTSDVTINLTINSVGGSLTTGSARITVFYVQN